MGGDVDKDPASWVAAGGVFLFLGSGKLVGKEELLGLLQSDCFPQQTSGRDWSGGMNEELADLPLSRTLVHVWWLTLKRRVGPSFLSFLVVPREAKEHT